MGCGELVSCMAGQVEVGKHVTWRVKVCQVSMWRGTLG